MTTCLIIATCLFDLTAVPPSPPIRQAPVVVTWYDPALCYEGETVNCDSHPELLADGLPWSGADYGRVAACPMELHYATVTIGGRDYLCRDTGGSIRFEYSPDMGWHVHIDLLARPGTVPDYQIVAGGTW